MSWQTYARNRNTVYFPALRREDPTDAQEENPTPRPPDSRYVSTEFHEDKDIPQEGRL